MSAQDKVRYQQEITVYREPVKVSSSLVVIFPPHKEGSHVGVVVQKTSSSAAKMLLKDPYAPKTPKSGFQMFMSHNRESFTLLNITLNEFRVEMSQLWKRLSEDDKSVWYSMAKQDQLRYEAEVNAYTPPAYLSTNAVRTRKRLDELKKVARTDADAPQLPMTAYHIYLTHKRREIQVQQPRLKHNDVMRQVGLTWKALSAFDREPYLRKAEQDTKRFEKDMERYLGAQVPPSVSSSFGDSYSAETQTEHGRANGRKRRKVADVAETTARSKRKKHPETPRQPQTAYNLMYMSKRAEILAAYQMSHNECSALCGRMWRQMSEQDREPYHRMAEEDRLRYEAEMNEFRTRLEQSRVEEAEVIRRNSLGFRHFLSAKRRGDDELSYDDIAAMWNNMTESHRTLWEELASEHGDRAGHAFEGVLVGEEAGDEEDERRRLEENAHVVLAARAMHHGDGDDDRDEDDDDGDADGNDDSDYPVDSFPFTLSHPDRNLEPQSNPRREQTLGFRYYVESKRTEHFGERNRWTSHMWASEWESFDESQRALWEELAEEHAVEALSDAEDDGGHDHGFDSRIHSDVFV